MAGRAPARSAGARPAPLVVPDPAAAPARDGEPASVDPGGASDGALAAPGAAGDGPTTSPAVDASPSPPVSATVNLMTGLIAAQTDAAARTLKSTGPPKAWSDARAPRPPGSVVGDGAEAAHGERATPVPAPPAAPSSLDSTARPLGLHAPAGLRAPGRTLTIVTTAALPWLTGTAVNPALRAAYLARALPQSKVVLLAPWLTPRDQEHIFPPGVRFGSPGAQEAHARAWLAARTGFPPTCAFRWYQGRYCTDLKSIFPVGSAVDAVPPAERDVVVLEEPEHLTWFHHGPRWADACAVVIGVAHTNYIDYIREAKGRGAAALIGACNGALVRAHTHACIKLSGAVQALPRQVIAFVHGVAPAFLEAGREAGPGEGGYYVGKALWAKGYRTLIALQSAHAPGRAPGAPPPPLIHAYGSGEDAAAISQAVAACGAAVALHPGVDHLDPGLRAYRAFVNPSTSDVVATTSVEALALGRWLVVPRHACNEWVGRFRACLQYDPADAASYDAALARALSEPPPPLAEDEARQLTWEAATARFLDAAEASLAGGGDGEPRGSGIGRALSGVAAAAAYRAYAAASGVEAVRRALGAGAHTRDFRAADVGGVDPASPSARGARDARAHAARAAAGYGRARYVGAA